jgi:hypothetical protein
LTGFKNTIPVQIKKYSSFLSQKDKGKNRVLEKPQ